MATKTTDDDLTAPPPTQEQSTSADVSETEPSSEELWRRKAESCEALRVFEEARRAQIDRFQTKDRAYWRQFEEEIRGGQEENARLQRFFSLRIQADLAYAEALRKIRMAVDASQSTASTAGAAASSGGSVASADSLNVQSSVSKALHTLGEVQQQLSEKLVQFTNVVKRDVMARPLDEMAATYSERIAAMLAEGGKLDAMLYQTQQNVVAAFAKYDALFREMEGERGVEAAGVAATASRRQDLWLAEMNYCVNVQKLQQCRVEYVTGMAALFQQYKSMEVWRASVVQTALDTYTRKQKLTYGEMAGAMAEPMASAQVQHRLEVDCALMAI
ncbi:hypothetical protein BBJ28_00018691 [Nothophytophthora sp. Chile5]|nr:hypothetical protein BBJ28_00018691 [Nothophytophthora sp. Chile5]